MAASNSAEKQNDPAQVRLKNGLNLSDLMSAQGAVFDINFEELERQETEEYDYDSEEVLKHINLECCDLVDEDTYQEGEPFEKIAERMQNLTDDKGVKKRILREGYGDVVPERALVEIHYNAYLEYNEEPFDSTYMQKRPRKFHVGEGAVIPGLDIAIKGMKLNEKAQFLIAPEYAFGKLGCLQRVPANATVLFEVELKNYVDSGGKLVYSELPEEKKQDFDEIYKLAHAMCSKAKNLFGRGLTWPAIREYNMAVAKLELCVLKDYDDQEKQQQLLHRLFSNLVVAYTKVNEPRRACSNCNKMYNICKGTKLKVPAKVYFNHARSLILLSDFDAAERKLKQALKLEPNNSQIANEFLKLDAKKKECHDKELLFSKAIFKHNEINKDLDDKTEVTKEFCDSLTHYCKDLLSNPSSMQYNLPEKLTKKEFEFCEKEVRKHNLLIKRTIEDGVDKYFITKPSVSE